MPDQRRQFIPLTSKKHAQTPEMPPKLLAAQILQAVYSRNVKRFVCKMFIALVASYESITHEMFISLAPNRG